MVINVDLASGLRKGLRYPRDVVILGDVVDNVN
jgi:hypothetical protein